MSMFDKRVAQVEEATKEVSRDTTSAEELLLSTEGEKSREHYRMLIDNYAASSKDWAKAKLDASIPKAEEANIIPERAKGKAEAPFAPSTARRPRRARRSEDEDEEFGRDS
eukprot:jgi/Tetstr1/433372/TSEL_022657.t1